MSDDVVGAVVGAPEPTASVDYKPRLEGFGPDKIVTVYNPLTQDFRVQYARQLAVQPTLSPGAQLARDRAGIDLSKAQGIQGHAVQYHVLKAGKTENLPGDIAQIAVRQLVNYILTTRPGKGNNKMTADPQSRKDVEQEIIIAVADSTSFFNQQAPVDEEVPNPPPGTGANYEPKPSTKAS